MSEKPVVRVTVKRTYSVGDYRLEIVGDRANFTEDVGKLLRKHAALEADLARATALLRRLVEKDYPCRPRLDDDWCDRHGFTLPCPVGETRAWLEQRDAP